MALVCFCGSSEGSRCAAWGPDLEAIAGQPHAVAGVDVELVGEAPKRYGIRDARSGGEPLHERARHDAPAGALVAAIAAALELGLAETQRTI